MWRCMFPAPPRRWASQTLSTKWLCSVHTKSHHQTFHVVVSPQATVLLAVLQSIIVKSVMSCHVTMELMFPLVCCFAFPVNLLAWILLTDLHTDQCCCPPLEQHCTHILECQHSRVLQHVLDCALLRHILLMECE